jgi:NADH-quinone oxidoreductase subunit D
MPFEVSDLAEMDAPEKEYLWTLNFGPQHPATHTTLRLILTLDGETVINALPHIGYLHSGFEKLGEHLDFNQYVTIVDRMNYIMRWKSCWASRSHRAASICGRSLPKSCGCTITC